MMDVSLLAACITMTVCVLSYRWYCTTATRRRKILKRKKRRRRFKWIMIALIKCCKMMLIIIKQWLWIMAMLLIECYQCCRSIGKKWKKTFPRIKRRITDIWWTVKGWILSLSRKWTLHSFGGILNDLSPQQIKEMNEQYDQFFCDTLGSPKRIMAPMVLRSDLAFRMMCRKYKCSLCYTPMIRASRIIDAFQRDGNVDKQLLFHKEDRPLIVQLCSDDADEIVAAAKIIEGFGDICDGIDINLGCPQRCAREEHFGAFLMDEPGTVQSMITALCSSCSLPISAKIRILPTMEETLRFTDLLIHSGISMLTVHGRRRERVHHDGPADLDCIRIIKQRYREQYGLTIPIVSNGNITTAEDAEHNLKFTKCDAVMSAWGLMVNPYLFDAKRTKKYGKYLPLEASLEYLKMVEKYGINKTAAVNGHLTDFFQKHLDGGSEVVEKVGKLMRLHEVVNSIPQWIACVELMAFKLKLLKNMRRTQFSRRTRDVDLLIKCIRKDKVTNIRLEALRVAKCKKVAPMEQRINALFGSLDSSSDSESDAKNL